MSSPVWSNSTVFASPVPSADGPYEDVDSFLLDADPEKAQGKRLLSISSSTAGLDANSSEKRTWSSKARHRLPSPDRAFRHLPRKSIIITFIAATTLLLAFGLTTTTDLRVKVYRHQPSSPSAPSAPVNLFASPHSDDGVWPEALGPGGTSDLCDICDCATQPGLYAPKPIADRYQPRTPIIDLFPIDGSVNRDGYMRQAILDIYCSRQHMSTPQTTRLVRRTASHLEQMMSWNVSGVDFTKPTIYLTTNTSPNGKANDLRPQFFRRHARTILDWQTAQANASTSADWQVLWVIVEDELDIDPKVIQTLRRIGVPYIYYAYGPTNGLGHAQRNAAMQLIYTLTQARQRGGLFGHGPVYCLDDDNKIETPLLGLLTKLDRIGVFPVGNFGVKGGYEIPLVSPIGEVMGSNSPWPNRTYPFDNAGFAFNSSLLGTKISGPTFWKWNQYGGESEFIGQIVSDVRQLEPLCGRDKEQNCHFAWHNEPLVGLETLSDELEMDFINRFGWDMWRTRSHDELDARAHDRGY